MSLCAATAVALTTFDSLNKQNKSVDINTLYHLQILTTLSKEKGFREYYAHEIWPINLKFFFFFFIAEKW